MRDVLVEKTRRALDNYLAENPAQPSIAIAGGVAANQALRGGVAIPLRRKGRDLYRPATAVVHRQCSDDRLCGCGPV